jgi:hypothetical protein
LFLKRTLIKGKEALPPTPVCFKEESGSCTEVWEDRFSVFGPYLFSFLDED